MKRILSILLSIVMVLGLVLVSASASSVQTVAEEKGTGSTSGSAIEDYNTFLFNLGLLEELAFAYVDEVNPGKDPLDLVIKYIRTGVDRYNSGSWGIMAGYEDPDFAEFVAAMEDMLNAEAGEEILTITRLKNLKNFTLPNGDMTDIGHMFGTMDITYHNNFSVNHADVAGWAGDLVDLLEFADVNGVNGTLEEMIEEVAKYIVGMSYTPYKAENMVDGFVYELNDVVAITDKNGNTFNAVVLEYETSSRIKSNVSASTQTETNTDYKIAGCLFYLRTRKVTASLVLQTVKNLPIMGETWV